MFEICQRKTCCSTIGEKTLSTKVFEIQEKSSSALMQDIRKNKLKNKQGNVKFKKTPGDVCAG